MPPRGVQVKSTHACQTTPHASPPLHPICQRRVQGATPTVTKQKPKNEDRMPQLTFAFTQREASSPLPEAVSGPMVVLAPKADSLHPAAAGAGCGRRRIARAGAEGGRLQGRLGRGQAPVRAGRKPCRPRRRAGLRRRESEGSRALSDAGRQAGGRPWQGQGGDALPARPGGVACGKPAGGPEARRLPLRPLQDRSGLFR